MPLPPPKPLPGPNGARRLVRLVRDEEMRHAGYSTPDDDEAAPSSAPAHDHAAAPPALHAVEDSSTLAASAPVFEVPHGLRLRVLPSLAARSLADEGLVRDDALTLADAQVNGMLVGVLPPMLASEWLALPLWLRDGVLWLACGHADLAGAHAELALFFQSAVVLVPCEPAEVEEALGYFYRHARFV